MTVAGFEVFDCHHHVGDASALVLGRIDEAGAPGPESEMAARLEIMDRGGVDRAVVIPGHGYERTDGIGATRRVNDAIAAYRDARPERFPVAIGVVEPQHGAASLDELDRCRRDLGLAGISFHARFQGVSTDDPWIRRYVERMGELGLVPVLHALTETVDEALWKVVLVARSFPDLPMLAVDAFASFEGSKEALAVADTCPNLLFDTSLSYNADLIETFVRRHGAHRVVFGTDLYSPPVGRRISHLLDQIVEWDLPAADIADVLAGNAHRLFAVEG